MKIKREKNIKKNKIITFPVKIYILFLMAPIYTLIMHALGNISHLYDIFPSGYKILLIMVWAIFIIGITIGVVTFLLALFNNDPWICIISSLGTVFLTSAFIHFKSNISNYFISVPVIQLFWSIFFFLIILAKIIHHPSILNNYFENFIKKYNYFLDCIKKYRTSAIFFGIVLIFLLLYHLQYFSNQMDQSMLIILMFFFFFIFITIATSIYFNFKFENKREAITIFFVPIFISLLLLPFELSNLMASPLPENFNLESSIFFSFNKYIIPFVANLMIFLMFCVVGIFIFRVFLAWPEIIRYLFLPFLYFIICIWNYLRLTQRQEEIEFRPRYFENLNLGNLQLYLYYSFEFLIAAAILVIIFLYNTTLTDILELNNTLVKVGLMLFILFIFIYPLFFVSHLTGIHYKDKSIDTSIFHKIISLATLIVFILRLFEDGWNMITIILSNLGATLLIVFGLSFGFLIPLKFSISEFIEYFQSHEIELRYSFLIKKLIGHTKNKLNNLRYE